MQQPCPLLHRWWLASAMPLAGWASRTAGHLVLVLSGAASRASVRQQLDVARKQVATPLLVPPSMERSGQSWPSTTTPSVKGPRPGLSPRSPSKAAGGVGARRRREPGGVLLRLPASGTTAWAALLVPGIKRVGARSWPSPVTVGLQGPRPRHRRRHGGVLPGDRRRHPPRSVPPSASSVPQAVLAIAALLTNASFCAAAWCVDLVGVKSWSTWRRTSRSIFPEQTNRWKLTPAVVTAAAAPSSAPTSPSSSRRKNSTFSRQKPASFWEKGEGLALFLQMCRRRHDMVVDLLLLLLSSDSNEDVKDNDGRLVLEGVRQMICSTRLPGQE